ncbi:MAG: flagellar filament capping protein FliD [Chitinispirillaceae bacterium]|nr:flagellar filament capping protein FliD [Chitinispirillaceae bacterium]
MGISVNGPSGIDTTSLIEQLVELEYSSKVTPVEERKEAYEVSINAYSTLKSLISELSTKATAIDELTDFNLYTTTSTDEESASISGSTGCEEGNFTLSVYHKATFEKLASGNNLVTSQTDSLSSQGISTGTFSINGIEITINNDDTLQDLRMKINNATDSDGKRPEVSASVLKIADDNFRLVLAAENSGENGIECLDISGSTLQDLGIIISSDGEKGIIHQQIESVDSVQSDLSDLMEGSIIRISGKDHNGNSISGLITASESMTGNDYLQAVSNIFHGTVTASFNGDGALIITDSIGGNSLLEFSFDVFGDKLIPDTECTVTGQCGKNVLSCGSNAFFSVDGIALESESNDIDDVIGGASLHIKKTTGNDVVELSIERDIEAVTGKISAFVTSYNSLRSWVDSATNISVSEDGEETEKGDLAGDMTASSIMNRITAVFRRQFSSVAGKYQNLASIGITTDYKTGSFHLDTDDLKDALASDFDDVMSLFVTNGSSSTTGIVLGRSSADTESGEYEIEKMSDGYRLRLSGTGKWYESESVTGEIVTFDEGPAKGLSLTISVSSLATGETTTFRYSQGFGDTLESICDELTDGSASGDGMIKLRQDSLNRNINYADDRIEMLTTRIENYRERLTKQYAAMEQALSTMESQMTSLLSALESS